METKEIRKILTNKLRTHPYLVSRALFALIKGYYYKAKFKLTFKNIRIGKYFRVYGKLNVVCIGKINIGNNVYIDSYTIKPVCFIAHTPNSQIVIHDNCSFNGTTIQAHEKIEINEMTNIADAYIVDSQVHSLDSDRRTNPAKKIKIKPVTIAKNVWISTNVTILHGVTIGTNSVIGACSLVRKDVPPNVFAAGNPLKIIKSIE